VANLSETVNGASRRARPLLGPFAETKGPRLPGRNPALPSSEKNLNADSLKADKNMSIKDLIP